jgi:uncharacterized protein involved in outer membrane biogenesis
VKRVWQVLAGIGILAVALMVALVVFLSTIDPNDYRGVLADPVKQATGRDLTFTGVRELKIGLPIAITVDGVQFSNATWGSRPEMATVQRMEVELAVLPLVLGELHIDRIVVRGVNLLLESDAKGRGNWVFAPAQEPKTSAAAEAPPGGKRTIPFVRTLALRDVTVTYRDGRTGRSDRVELASLELSAEGANSPMSLNLEAKINKAPLALEGTIGSLRGLFQSSQPFPVALEVKALGATLAAKGAIAHPLEAKGLDLTVSLAGEGLAKQAAHAGLALPELPKFSVTGRLTDPEGSYALEGLKANLGKTSVSGQVKLSLAGKRPRIEAALGAQALDLGELGLAAPDKEAGAPPGKAERGKRVIPDTALPLEALGALDAKLLLKVDRLVLAPDLTAEQVAVSAELERGRLAVRPDFGRLAKGRLGGRLQVGQAGAVTARLEARGIVLGELLKAFDVTEAIEDGPFDADLDLRGKGADLRQLLAGADGQVKVVIGEGRIQGRLLDLAGADLLSQVIGAVDPRTEENQATGLKCGVLRAAVKSGKATFDKGIGIETDKINIVGAGTIDLKTEAVDLGIRSAAREGLEVSVAGAASKLVRVRGTLAEPSIGVDALGAAETAARVGGAVITGGLSLLGEFAFDKLKGQTPPCKLALGDAAGEAKTGDVGEPKSKQEKQTGGAGVLEGIGKNLKSLFGD